MAVLATSYGDGPRPLPQVAADEGIPFGYLEHIAQGLRRSGLVHARRGAAGGYELARAPEEITVADVLRAVGGEVLPTECGIPEGCFYHDRLEQCVTRPIWQDIQRKIEESLSAVTLASVVGLSTADSGDERQAPHGN